MTPTDSNSFQLKRRTFLALSGTAAGAAAASWSAGPRSHAAPPDPSQANPLLDEQTWHSAAVLIDDNCENLVAGGWLAKSLESGAYVLDAPVSPANPFGLELPAVAAGRYRLRADELGLPSPGMYAQFRRALPLAGKGPWRLDLDLNIRDVPVVTDWHHTRGLTLTLVIGGFTHNYTLVDRDQLLLWSGSGGVGRWYNLPIPYDDAVHRWSWVFDGIDTTTLLLDDNALATFRNVRYSGGASSILFRAFAQNIESGAVDVEFDRVVLRQLTQAEVPLGDGSDLVAAGWQVDPARPDCWITDFARSSGVVAAMPDITSGDIHLHSEAGADTATARFVTEDRAATVGVTASIRFDRIAAGSSPTEGVLDLVVDLARHRHLFRFGADGRLDLLGDEGESLHSVASAYEVDELFHAWHFGEDSAGRLFVACDGIKLIDGMVALGGAPSEAPEFSATVDASTASTGATDILIAKLTAIGGVATAWYDPRVLVSLLPTATATSASGIVHLRDVDPADLADRVLRLTVTGHAGDGLGHPVGEPLHSLSLIPTAMDVPFTLELPTEAEYVVRVALHRDGTMLTEDQWRFELPDEVVEATSGGVVELGARASELFSNVELCEGPGGTNLWSAGWQVGTYSYEGTDVGGAFLEATAAAEPLTVPVRLNGWVSVAVGYLSGSADFVVNLGGDDQLIAVPGEAAESDPYGARVVGEVVVATEDCSGDQLTISPSEGAGAARIAWIRFTGLTADEVAVASAGPDPQPKRVIYNNDGYSSFFTGQYDTPEDLVSRAIDIYADSDTEALTFQSGTTLYTNYDSEVAGTPYEKYPVDPDAARTGDTTAMEAILGYVTRGEVPAELLAARGAELDVKVFSGLRMNTFYSMSTFPWLSGNRYEEFATKHLYYYNGTPYAARLTQTHPEYRTLLRQLLTEQANFVGIAGVDLDFGRYPEAVGWEKPLVDAYQSEYGVDPRLDLSAEGSLQWQKFRAEPVNQFMRELRSALGDRTIMVRFPQSCTLSFGLDIETWVEERLVDILVPTNVSTETFWGDHGRFTELVAGTGILLYGGTSGTLGGTDPSREDEDLVNRGFPSRTGHTMMDATMYRERAAEFYRAGYDGIYVFNDWDASDSLNRVGDRHAVARWRTFTLPSQWRQGFVVAVGGGPATIDDLVDLIDSAADNRLLSSGDAGRLRLAAVSARTLLTRGSTDAARGRLESILDQITDLGADVGSSTNTQLRIMTRHILADLAGL